MKKFNVYGIGNALVDIDFEVSEATLARLDIDKGLMTLIDEAKHHKLLEELDGIKHLKACGGSAANTLFTVQQLGGKTFYSCKVGDDEMGDFFYRDLLLHGVNTNLHECPREGVTGKCIVLVTPDADRTMNTFLGATANFSIAQLSEYAIQHTDYLYIEGYLVASPTGCEAAIVARNWARKQNVKVALTLSDPNMVTYFKKELLSIIRDHVDIIFANEQEALLFTGKDNLQDATEELKKYTKTFVVTQGGEGALMYDGNEYLHAPAYQVNVVDTVGAGDVFAGAFLYSLSVGKSFYDAGNLASLAASRVVAKFGPRLNQEEMDSVKEIIKNQLHLSEETTS